MLSFVFLFSCYLISFHCEVVSHSFPKLCAAVAKKVTGVTALCVSRCDATPADQAKRLQPGELFRRERGDDLFEARIAAERIPVGMEFE